NGAWDSQGEGSATGASHRVEGSEMVNSCHAGAAGRPEDVQCVLVARSPDRLALVVEPVDELPIPSVQTLDEPARDAAQRHPVTIVPGALVGHGVHILVST